MKTGGKFSYIYLDKDCFDPLKIFSQNNPAKTKQDSEFA